MNKNKPQQPDVDRPEPETPDRQAPPRTGEGSTDMRKANENIRKSQGDEVGRPTIDRHR
jgi:hypothetical protein